MWVLVEAGMTNRFIASRVELPLSTVATIAARVRREGTAARRRRAGRPRFLSAREGRHLQLLVYRHRTWSLDQLTAEVNRFMTRKICSRTVRRYLHRALLLNYVAVTKPYLTSHHVSQRLRWARNMVSWTLSRWEDVAFSDESTFTVRPERGEARVWRRSHERYLPACLRPSFKSGRLSLSVWAAFSARGRTPLVRVNGRLNQFQYVDIIHEHLLPFIEDKHGGTGNFLLLEDNCGSHRALRSGKYMALHGVQRLDWVPQNPDMNAIENLWAMLEARLRDRPQPPTTLDDLFDALCEEWARLPDSYLSAL